MSAEDPLQGVKVEDVLVQTAVVLLNLAARSLDQDDRDQAKQAIDGVRALMPLCPEDAQTALREPLSQLQLAWAAPGTKPEPEPEPKPASKLWTPPGTT